MWWVAGNHPLLPVMISELLLLQYGLREVVSVATLIASAQLLANSRVCLYDFPHSSSTDGKV